MTFVSAKDAPLAPTAPVAMQSPVSIRSTSVTDLWRHVRQRYHSPVRPPACATPRLAVRDVERTKRTPYAYYTLLYGIYMYNPCIARAGF
jgi:hypothetical protein